MYTISRLEGAELLSVSTRTIDRYIRLGRIRMKKIWKTIQLHEEDVDRLKRGGIREEVTIVPKPRADEGGFRARPIESGGLDYKTLYENAKSELERKDASVREMAYALGKIETELKNTISLAEHKKATYLLESSRSRTEEAAAKTKADMAALESALASGRSVNIALSVATLVMVAIAAVAWFASI